MKCAPETQEQQRCFLTYDLAFRREILWEEGEDGRPLVTGVRLAKASHEEVVTADAYVAALDVPGAKRLIPEAWRRFPAFDNIHKLVGVPVVTVQLRWSVFLQ